MAPLLTLGDTMTFRLRNLLTAVAVTALFALAISTPWSHQCTEPITAHRPTTSLPARHDTHRPAPPTSTLPPRSVPRPTTPYVRPPQPSRPALTPSSPTSLEMAEWGRVNICEEGGDWTATGPIYSGGLGISRTNWIAYGGTQFAPTGAQATPAQQVTVAMRIQGSLPVPDQNGCAAW